jgi:hypothetical protein
MLYLYKKRWTLVYMRANYSTTFADYG